jgi:hypothetical protein
MSDNYGAVGRIVAPASEREKKKEYLFVIVTKPCKQDGTRSA